MARRKRARRERVVIITGDQRTDVDARAIARVLIRLARHWAAEQDDGDTDSIPPTVAEEESS